MSLSCCQKSRGASFPTISACLLVASCRSSAAGQVATRYLLTRRAQATQQRERSSAFGVAYLGRLRPTQLTVHRLENPPTRRALHGANEACFWRWTSKAPQQRQVSERPARELSQAELLALVDDYEISYGTDGLLPELKPRYAPANGPHLVVTDKQQDEWPPWGWEPSDPDIRRQVDEISRTLTSKVTQDNLTALFDMYKSLPSPHVTHLPARLRHKLLWAMSVVEKRDQTSMLRYFSILEDMKKCAIPLNLHEWNSAITFAARYTGFVSTHEVETALHLWREMEHNARVKGNHVTFNILFNSAAKAGKFVLAEMIYKEMQARGIEFDRYHHVSLIKYNGLRRNGDAVRAAYKALVRAGEIVDARVLNAMISALIDCGELPAAENIYERMKQHHLKIMGQEAAPRISWHDQRAIDRALTNLARLPSGHPARVTRAPPSLLSPNIHTFRILMHNIATTDGTLEKVLQLTDDMRQFNIPLDEFVFLHLLRAFAVHGGVLYTQWTSAWLDRIWQALLHAVDHEIDGLVMTDRLVSQALAAFGKCSNTIGIVRAWEDIKKRWTAEPETVDGMVVKMLRPALQCSQAPATEDDWILGLKRS